MILPIGQRELRVAARAPSSYWGRCAFAGTAALVFAVHSLLSTPRVAPIRIFEALTVLCFVMTLFSGVVLTSDRISSERREGTLGLLFLTALKARDVVAGNLAGSSLKSLCGLLAVLPILSLALIFGGVSLGEFGRVCLALLSSLAFAHCLCFMTSCAPERYVIAPLKGFAGVVFFNAALPALVILARKVPLGVAGNWVTTIGLCSPWTTLSLAPSTLPFRLRQFWISLVTVNLLSAGFLIVACALLSRSWRSEPHLGTSRPRQRTAALWRKRLLDSNPISWLASRHTFAPFGLLCLFLAIGLLACCLAPTFSPVPGLGRMFPVLGRLMHAWYWAAGTMHLVVFWALAAAACSRLASDRKSGALELILVSPIDVGRILRGQRLALLRQFAGPVVALLLAQGLLLWGMLSLEGLRPGNGLSAWQVLVQAKRALDANPQLWRSLLFDIGLSVGCEVMFFSTLAALASAGAWIALRARRPSFAPWLALLFVLAPPFALYLCVLIGADWLGFSRGDWAATSLLLLLSAWIPTTLFQAALSRWRLRNFFRLAAAEKLPVVMLPDRRAIIRVAAVIAGIWMIGSLLYLNENRRGESALKRLKHNAAKVQAPEAIPDSENFGAAPILQALSYRIDGQGRVRWEDDPGFTRLMKMGVTGKSREPLRSRTAYLRAPNEPYSNWALHRATDFQACAKFYLGTLMVQSKQTNLPAQIVLDALGQYDQDLKDLHVASLRPSARFSVLRDVPWSWQIHPFPHHTLFENVSDILQLRACAKLELGDTDGALADITFAIRLALSLQFDPGLESLTVRHCILLDALQPVWEGLARRRWSGSQIARLEELFQIDLFVDYPMAVREEFRMVSRNLEFFGAADPRLRVMWNLSSGDLFAAKIIPRGWMQLNQAAVIDVCEKNYVPIIDPDTHRFHPAKLAAASSALQRSGVFLGNLYSLAFGPEGFWPIRQKYVTTLVHAQASLDETVIACALEAFRQKENAYPKSLNQLARRIPNDPVTGRPFAYKVQDDLFVLYSIGANERDDGGLASGQGPWASGVPRQSISQGDWVWKYP